MICNCSVYILCDVSQYLTVFRHYAFLCQRTSNAPVESEHTKYRRLTEVAAQINIQ